MGAKHLERCSVNVQHMADGIVNECGIHFKNHQLFCPLAACS